MKLRWRFVLYVVRRSTPPPRRPAVPFLVANPLWLLAAEVGLALSLLVGLRLVRGLFRTLALIQDGAQFLRDRDFTARLRETDQPELDTLVGVYNQMVDHLRQERARLQEQHHFLAQILEQSPSAIVVLDFDGAISLCNPAASGCSAAGPPDRPHPRPRPPPRRLPPGRQPGPALHTLAGGETRVVPLPDGAPPQVPARHASSTAAFRAASS